MIPDWQLPDGVDRGLWDYLHSADMAEGYDAMMMLSPLATADVRFCQRHFPPAGRVLDLGCGTGRLAAAFDPPAYDYLGIDLSDEMLAVARRHERDGIRFLKGNVLDLPELVEGKFDAAACLFSTFGMIRGNAERERFLKGVFDVLKPGGVFVLHAHSRRFVGLGPRRWGRRELTMPQAYGGAPLTLAHFSRGEVVGLLKRAGFMLNEAMPVGVGGPLRRPWLAAGVRAYGYLIAASIP